MVWFVVAGIALCRMQTPAFEAISVETSMQAGQSGKGLATFPGECIRANMVRPAMTYFHFQAGLIPGPASGRVRHHG
jgi:hypothetical protein